MTKKRISNKQKAFINEYVQCWNATEAARIVGYKHPNVQGSRLLAKVSIKEEIEKRVKEMCMSGDEALRLLSEQARSTLDDCFDIELEESKIKPGVMIVRHRLNLIKAKKNGKLHLIKSIIPTAHGTKVELYSSQRALELIGKAHRLFIDKVEHDDKVEITVKYDDELKKDETKRNSSETT